MFLLSQAVPQAVLDGGTKAALYVMAAGIIVLAGVVTLLWRTIEKQRQEQNALYEKRVEEQGEIVTAAAALKETIDFVKEKR